MDHHLAPQMDSQMDPKMDTNPRQSTALSWQHYTVAIAWMVEKDNQMDHQLDPQIDPQMTLNGHQS